MKKRALPNRRTSQEEVQRTNNKNKGKRNIKGYLHQGRKVKSETGGHSRTPVGQGWLDSNIAKGDQASPPSALRQRTRKRPNQKREVSTSSPGLVLGWRYSDQIDDRALFGHHRRRSSGRAWAGAQEVCGWTQDEKNTRNHELRTQEIYCGVNLNGYPIGEGQKDGETGSSRHRISASQ